ncbi:hypothetical protein [Actinoplanes sp. NPDC020271]|uniref:hypothetical protein n=1 Tax=Actinoplanes sp. NPDC020271 TaxID=3363896 RepID=UPI00379EA294
MITERGPDRAPLRPLWPGGPARGRRHGRPAEREDRGGLTPRPLTTQPVFADEREVLRATPPELVART